MNSREIVNKCLSFNNPDRAPRQLWLLPAMAKQYPMELKRIQKKFPDDIIWCPEFLTVKPEITGDPYKKGEYTDPWGCKFQNLQDGIIGEVKEPLIVEEDWEDSDKLTFPESIQSIDVERINRFCRESDKFILSGFNPRPFERLQWIRGTEQLYMDIALRSDGFESILSRIHDFYCRLVEKWCQTEIDALFIQDDWGAQNSLLINPETWVEIFKPLYRDYAKIAKKYNKKVFMHSDGNISSIIHHLIDIGIDALNSQLFCMNIEELRQYKGQITFWGEIDRQDILNNGSIDDVEKAVNYVHDNLWSDGGCIAQCSFDLGGRPENIEAVFEIWEKLTQWES